MIKITTITKNNIIDSINVKGHAKYDDYGKDIVCASVSSIITTTINAILSINSNAIEYKSDEGYINIKILAHDEITNKLIKNMIDLLKSLEKNYAKNIKIIEEVSKCHN